MKGDSQHFSGCVGFNYYVNFAVSDDKHRVLHQTLRAPTGTDYINASHARIPHTERRYLLSQVLFQLCTLMFVSTKNFFDLSIS